MDPGNKGIERAVPLYSELVQVYNDYEDTILKLWFEAKDASLFGESNQNNTIDLSIGSFSIPVNIEMQTEIGAITYYNNVTDILNISHKYFSNGIKPIIIRIKPILTEIDNYTFSSLQINSFTCNNSNLYGVDTEQAIFLDAIIDLSNCNLGKKFLTRTRNDGSVSNRSVHNNNSFWGVSELNISDNPTLDVDISEFNTIKHKLYANNTPLQGDLASISVISELELINTNVYFYSSVPYIRCLNIKWYNSNTNILVNSLNDLIRDLYEGSLNNGTLYIAGDNPDIEDEQILYYIFKLVHDRFWTIIYNGYYVTSENEANYLQTGEDNYIYTK